MQIAIWENLIFAVGTTITFAMILQAKKRYLLIQGIIGALGWYVYMVLKQEQGQSSFIANFTAALLVAAISEIVARILKQPATILVIPSIFPLVPGLGMYLGMSKIITRNYDLGINILLTAAGDAASIALGIMVITSICRMLKILLKPAIWGRPQ